MRVVVKADKNSVKQTGHGVQFSTTGTIELTEADLKVLLDGGVIADRGFTAKKVS